jgi:DNA end-binding protein Ku
MAIRSIASLSLTFGLVSIPVKVYLATESSASIKFKLMSPHGARVRQQYVADAPSLQDVHPAVLDYETQAAPAPAPRVPVRGSIISAPAPEHDRPFSAVVDSDYDAEAHVIERAQMLKGFEFEKGQFVLFTPAELNALAAESRQTIDIVCFIPEGSVDPIYYDKAYFLAPDRRASKPYSLLRQAMQETGRCALAKWAWRSKEYVVQIRPADGGMVLQQLLYADEVRSMDNLEIELSVVGSTELKLAMQLIEQIAEQSYDPHAFVDEEKQRILAAVQRKIAGKQIVSHGTAPAPAGGRVVDLVAALRASLASPPGNGRAKRHSNSGVTALATLHDRKPVRRARTSATAKSPKVGKG